MNVIRAAANTLLPVLGTALMACVTPAFAQTSGLPAKMQILVGVAAGGPNDAIARMIGQRFTSKYGISTVVINQTGANGMLAARTLAASPPNGEHILIASQGLITITPHLSPTPFDPAKHFTPISGITTTDVGLCIGNGVAANNMKEFVADAKQRPNPVRLGSAGVGNITHLMLEELRQVSGMPFTHVPYRGIAPALQDVMAGHVEGTLCAMVVAVPLLQAGKIKIIGMLGPTRSKLLPDVPTLVEQGFPPLGDTWYGMFGPPDMPQETVMKLFNAFKAVAEEADTIRDFNKVGLNLWVQDPPAFMRVINEESARWGKLIRDNQIKEQ